MHIGAYRCIVGISSQLVTLGQVSQAQTMSRGRNCSVTPGASPHPKALSFDFVEVGRARSAAVSQPQRGSGALGLWGAEVGEQRLVRRGAGQIGSHPPHPQASDPPISHTLPTHRASDPPISHTLPTHRRLIHLSPHSAGAFCETLRRHDMLHVTGTAIGRGLLVRRRHMGVWTDYAGAGDRTIPVQASRIVLRVC